MLIELDELHDKIGITFIYVTHDQQEALSVSDRVAVMNQGDVLQVGTPQDIYESPATDFVARFIGETNLFDGTVASVSVLPAQGLPPSSETNPPVLPEEDAVYIVELDIPELDRIKVTTVDRVEVGDRISFTIRPEKVKISGERPATKRGDINLFRGVVDEPIYSGFQTKFYVKVRDGVVFRVIKQHANYSDEGPDIVWKDEVYISWSADDGYIVETGKGEKKGP
jgi:spermidine/putrescine transport system ATP-binding protein